MNIVCSCIIVFFSAILGMIVEFYYEINLPPSIWWFWGVVTGVVASLVGATL